MAVSKIPSTMLALPETTNMLLLRLLLLCSLRFIYSTVSGACIAFGSIVLSPSQYLSLSIVPVLRVLEFSSTEKITPKRHRFSHSKGGHAGLRSPKKTIASFWIRPFLGRHSLGFCGGVSIFWYPGSRWETNFKWCFLLGGDKPLLQKTVVVFSGEFPSFGDENSHLHLKSWPGRRVSKRPFWPSVSWEAADLWKGKRLDWRAKSHPGSPWPPIFYLVVFRVSPLFSYMIISLEVQTWPRIFFTRLVGGFTS